VVSTLVVLSLVALLGWTLMSLSPLNRVEHPERALERVASRTFEIESAMKKAPEWERNLYKFFEQSDGTLEQVTHWYQELATYSQEPKVALYQAVLHAETGQINQIEKTVSLWGKAAPPFPLFAQWLEVGYLGTKSEPESILDLQAQLAEQIPNNWFYSQLAIRLGKQAGDKAIVMLTEQDLAERGERWLGRNRLILSAEAGSLIGGIVGMMGLFGLWYHRKSGALMIGEARLPPPWTALEGFAVLVRGGALTALLLLGFSFLPVNVAFFQVLTIPILFFPILFFVYRCLLHPHQLSIREIFGLRIHAGTGWRFLMVVMALVGAGLGGDWLIGIGAQEAGVPMHWANRFDPHFAWGSPLDLAVVLAEYVVLSPFLEECVFRGVIFSTFRAIVAWPIAVLLSAVVFAGAHGYGVVGFLMVLWSGLLWAWAYEKTGSLLPGMAAHGLNNLLVSLSLLAFLR